VCKYEGWMMVFLKNVIYLSCKIQDIFLINKHQVKNNQIFISCIVCISLLMSCSPTYSPYLYDQTAELKAQSLSVLSNANEPYSKYETRVDLLVGDLESVFQQEKMRKYNKVKIKQWDLLLAPDGYLLNGCLEKWEKDTVMSEEFINLQRKLIGEAFDLIQETEKQRISK